MVRFKSVFVDRMHFIELGHDKPIVNIGLTLRLAVWIQLKMRRDRYFICSASRLNLEISKLAAV